MRHYQVKHWLQRSLEEQNLMHFLAVLLSMAWVAELKNSISWLYDTLRKMCAVSHLLYSITWRVIPFSAKTLLRDFLGWNCTFRDLLSQHISKILGYKDKFGQVLFLSYQKCCNLKCLCIPVAGVQAQSEQAGIPETVFL